MNRNKNIQDLLSSFRLILDPITGGFYNENLLINIPRKVARHTNNMVYRNILILILKNTITYYLDIFMDNGGWNLTCIWLQEAVDTDIDMLIFDILTIIRNTTVTIDRLISNAIPCLIKQLLNTHINPEIKAISQDIVNDNYHRLLVTHHQNIMNNLISENEFDSMSDSEIEFDNTQNEKVFTMQPCSNQSKKICLQNFISNNTLPSPEKECSNKTIKIYKTATISQTMVIPKQEPMHQPQLKLHQDSLLNATTKSTITNKTIKKHNVVTINQGVGTPKPKTMHRSQLKFHQDTLLNSSTNSINIKKAIKKNNNLNLNGTNNNAMTTCDKDGNQKFLVQKSNVLDKTKVKTYLRKSDELDVQKQSEVKKFKPNIVNKRKITKPLKIESFIKHKQ